MLLIATLLATGEVRAQQAPPPAPVAVETPAPVAQPVPAAVARPVRSRVKGDPLEGMNRKLFAFHQRVDHAFFRPLAMFYKHVLPKPLRTAMRHILSNLGEPLIFMNDMLQLKPKRAARTFSRFVINTGVGIGGIFDVAKTADLPHHDNSLGDTLARYGVGPGPFLFVPFFGPTDVRDLLGGQAENLIYPLAIGDPFDRTDYQISAGLVAGLDLRAESDADFKALLDGAADPYATLRSVFQQSRAAEIAEIKGHQPTPGLDDPLTDPDAMASEAAPDAPPPDPVTPDAAAPDAAAPTPGTATPPPAVANPTPAPPVEMAPKPQPLALHTL